MHPESLIINMLLLLAAAVFFVTLFNRLGLGSILAYLVTGVLVGPGVLGWYEDPELILHISEIGIVLFLFVIGLELAPQRLWKMRCHPLLLRCNCWKRISSWENPTVN